MAAAAFDQPYYLYLCGGRSGPSRDCRSIRRFRHFRRCGCGIDAGARGWGRSSGDLAFGGVSIPIAGTLFVGVWLYVDQLGSVFSTPCVIDGDWVYPRRVNS